MRPTIQIFLKKIESNEVPNYYIFYFSGQSTCDFETCAEESRSINYVRKFSTSFYKWMANFIPAYLKMVEHDGPGMRKPSPFFWINWLDNIGRKILHLPDFGDCRFFTNISFFKVMGNEVWKNIDHIFEGKNCKEDIPESSAKYSLNIYLLSMYCKHKHFHNNDSQILTLQLIHKKCP